MRYRHLKVTPITVAAGGKGDLVVSGVDFRSHAAAATSCPRSRHVCSHLSSTTQSDLLKASHVRAHTQRNAVRHPACVRVEGRTIRRADLPTMHAFLHLTDHNLGRHSFLVNGRIGCETRSCTAMRSAIAYALRGATSSRTSCGPPSTSTGQSAWYGSRSWPSSKA